MAILIPYVKQTWVDGNATYPVSAARMGALEEGILDVSLAPAVRVYRTAVFSVATATLTAVTFDNERFDQAAGAASTQHDNVTNNSRLTCLYAGVYQITTCIEWAGASTGTVRIVQLRVNGATVIASASQGPPGTNQFQQGVSTLYALAVNDYVETIAYQDTGSALNVVAVGNRAPEFMMVRVG